MIGKIKRFNSIGRDEVRCVQDAMNDMPLSGYLAGRERGGFTVQVLEEEWATTFNVRHAIACNSATSGLLAAAFVIGLKSSDRFACSAMTMSATAAAPMFTGAKPFFCDVDDRFGLTGEVPHDAPIFVTNLFGHPARLHELRMDCDQRGTVLVEDNSQSPFAMENMKFTGTIGHIGVFSLNIHKPIQCGEGGVVTTDDDHLAKRLRQFINHGENGGDHIGLNLRMPEVCAAIALVQLRRGSDIIDARIEQAVDLRNAIGHVPGITWPTHGKGCRNVFYTIPFLIENRRAEFCAELRAAGVPIVEGYVDPLYRLPAFKKFARPCPVAESLHDRRLFYIENCAWDPTPEQIEQIGAAFRGAAERVL